MSADLGVQAMGTAKEFSTAGSAGETGYPTPLQTGNPHAQGTRLSLADGNFGGSGIIHDQ